MSGKSLELLSEGKTKRLLRWDSGRALVLSKDRITAGDGVKAHELLGKAVLSTQTNCAIFQFLNSCGLETSFDGRLARDHPDYEKAFIAKNCHMIPIEWVARRVATGSFLRRHANVTEGTRFSPPLLETFFKDDANHDPFWSRESLIGAKLEIGGLVIGDKEVDEMLAKTRLVFELLERVWSLENHSLIDMKIEFGVFESRLLVSDVIDNDSWRLWPNGEKRLMLDKQIYRDLKTVTKEDLQNVKQSFETVATRTQELFSRVLSLRSSVAIIVGSPSDLTFAQRIEKALKEKFSVSDVIIEVASAHKSTAKVLSVAARLQQWPHVKAIVAVAGFSNGLGPVIAGNVTIPVVSCPPETSADVLSLDVWSSLRMPSGMGCSTVLGAENAALNASLIVANDNPMVWSRVRTLQTNAAMRLIRA